MLSHIRVTKYTVTCDACGDIAGYVEKSGSIAQEKAKCNGFAQHIFYNGLDREIITDFCPQCEADFQATRDNTLSLQQALCAFTSK